jgi:hypothetical protein
MKILAMTGKSTSITRDIEYLNTLRLGMRDSLEPARYWGFDLL